MNVLSLPKARLAVVWLLIPPFFFFARPTPGTLLAGAALAAVGLAIRGWAAGTIVKNQELTTTGPYALSRNPLYLGSSLMGAGFAVAAGHWIVLALFLVLFTAFYLPLMRLEERRLEELFGAQFREYAAHVPLFLPRVLPRVRAGGARRTAGAGFSLAKYYGHREWQASLGVAAAFLALALRMMLPG